MSLSECLHSRGTGLRVMTIGRCFIGLLVWLLPQVMQGYATTYETAARHPDVNTEHQQRLSEIRSVLDKEAKEINGQCASFFSPLDQIVNDSKKLVVIIPHRSGLADRLLAVGTICTLGAVAGRMCLVGRREHLPDMEISFTYAHYNWSRAQDPDWVIDTLKEGGTTKKFNQSIMDTYNYFAVNGIENAQLDRQIQDSNLNDVLGGEAHTSLISLNRGKTLRLFQNSQHAAYLHAMGLHPYNAFGCMINYMFRPKEEIFLPIYDEFKVMTKPDTNVLKIGIQVRVGDAFWENPHKTIDLDHQYYMFFDCAEQIEAFEKLSRNYSTVIWYLLTESKALRKAVVLKYQTSNRIILSPVNITIGHTANENSVCGNKDSSGTVLSNCDVHDVTFQSATAEWWLMPYAHYFVISLFSGYGRSAAMRLLHGNGTIFTINSPRNNGVGVAVCERGQSTTLESLSGDWSGV